MIRYLMLLLAAPCSGADDQCSRYGQRRSAIEAPMHCRDDGANPVPAAQAIDVMDVLETGLNSDERGRTFASGNNPLPESA